MKILRTLALFAFFFSINFEVWDPLNTGGSFSVSKLTGYIYLLMMIPLLIRNRTSDKIIKLIKPILLLFLLLCIISIVNISSTSQGFFDFSIFQNIVLFWILLNHEEQDNQVLEKGMLSFALGSVVLAILYYAGIGIDYTNDRLTLFNDNQNNVGMRMSISVIILLMVVLQNIFKVGKLRYLLLTPIPVMLTLMAQTGSRVAFISFVTAFIAGVVLYNTKKMEAKFFVLVLGTLLLVVIWQFIMQSELLSTRIMLSITEMDISERDVIWKKILPLIKSNPVFGVGKTGYEDFSQRIFGQFTSPHNVIIEVLCLTGFTGLFLYLLFLYRVFNQSYKSYRSEKRLLPLLLTLPILGMMLSGQLLFVKIGWVIFAYASGNSALDSDIISNSNMNYRFQTDEDTLRN